jgi:hypothetical protein
MRSIKNKLQRFYLLIMAGALIIASVLVFSPAAFALSYLVKPEVIETNMNATGTSALIITFTTSASNTGTALSVTFPAGYTVNSTQHYQTTFGTPSCTAITGATSVLPGAPTATGSGLVITFAGITALSINHSYCGVLTGTSGVSNDSVTNPAAGVYSGSITAGTDQAAQFADDVISTDQVLVTATVPASFTLVISASSDPFTANLSALSIGATTGVTATVTTNGTGWYIYGTDSNTGLTSASTSTTIPSATVGAADTLTAGTAGYDTAITTAQNAGNYVAGAPGVGSGLSSTTMEKLVTGTGPTASQTAVFKEYAAISGVTPAATDYTDTITLVGAGTF